MSEFDDIVDRVRSREWMRDMHNDISINDDSAELATANADQSKLIIEVLATLRLILKRLTELNRDDEAGMRIVLANAIAQVEGMRP